MSFFAVHCSSQVNLSLELMAIPLLKIIPSLKMC